jgi:hypothetical protein
MPTNIKSQDGQSATNTQGQAQRSEEKGKTREIGHWEGSTGEDEKSREGKRAKQYAVYIENANIEKSPVFVVADTTDQVEASLHAFFPQPCLGFLFSEKPYGTKGHTYFEGNLSQGTDTLYVRLYLRKHPKLQN